MKDSQHNVDYVVNITKELPHNVDYVVNITKELPHNVDYVVWRSGISSLSHWDFEKILYD